MVESCSTHGKLQRKHQQIDNLHKLKQMMTNAVRHLASNAVERLASIKLVCITTQRSTVVIPSTKLFH